MSALIDWNALPPLLLGMAIGAIVGWVTNSLKYMGERADLAAREARIAAREAHLLVEEIIPPEQHRQLVEPQRPEEPEDDRQAVPWQIKTVMLVALGCSILGLILMGAAKEKSDKAADDARVQATGARAATAELENLQQCLRSNLVDIAASLNGRSEVVEALTEATNQLDEAQAQFLDKIAAPEATPKEQQNAFLAYRRALAAKLQIADHQDEVRAENPYPTEEDILTCDGKEIVLDEQ